MTPHTKESVIAKAGELRESLKEEEAKVRAYVNEIKHSAEAEGFNQGECIAQAMLALRHVEDARMRIGKVIQYADGGESVYDKK